MSIEDLEIKSIKGAYPALAGNSELSLSRFSLKDVQGDLSKGRKERAEPNTQLAGADEPVNPFDDDNLVAQYRIWMKGGRQGPKPREFAPGEVDPDATGKFEVPIIPKPK